MFDDLRALAKQPDPPQSAKHAASAVGAAHLHQEYWALYRSIDASAAASGATIIDFLSMRRGEGVSTIVSRLGLAAAVCGRRTLIIDMDTAEPTQQRNFGFGPPKASWAGWHDALDSVHGLDNKLYRHGTWPLFLLPPSPHLRALAPLGSEAFRVLLRNLASRFDLILIDSPAASRWPDGIELGRLADAVVLVVEAEKARWPAAASLKERCLQAGVNVLGVVLNKRRYYIPRLLYRLL
jgi:protein-tyrosine kinase